MLAIDSRDKRNQEVLQMVMLAEWWWCLALVVGKSRFPSRVLSALKFFAGVWDKPSSPPHLPITPCYHHHHQGKILKAAAHEPNPYVLFNLNVIQSDWIVATLRAGRMQASSVDTSCRLNGSQPFLCKLATCALCHIFLFCI